MVTITLPSSRMHRSALLALVLASGGVGVALATTMMSYLPADDEVVLELLPLSRDAKVRELHQLRQTLTAQPHDAALAADYARRAIALGRSQSDPRFYGYAAAALAPWFVGDDGASNGATLAPIGDKPADIVWLQATLMQQRHDFDGAMHWLDALLQREEFGPARLTRASLLLVQGRQREAVRDCAALARHDGLAATTCGALAASLDGRAVSALAALDTIMPQLDRAPVEQRLWTLTLAAEIASRLDRADEATQRFERALAAMRSAGPDRDAYLLAAYADHLLDQGQPQAVAALLHDDMRVDGLLLRVAIAERRLQQAGVATPSLDLHRQQLQARFDAVRLRGDTTHGREEAMFALHVESDATRALSLALANWQLQREPIDARLALEAANAAGEPAAAAPVRQWLRDHAIEDPLLQRLASPTPGNR